MPVVRKPDRPAERIAPAFTTQAGAATYLGVTGRTIRNMITDGRLPAYKLGNSRAVRIRIADLEAVLRPIPTAAVGGAA